MDMTKFKHIHSSSLWSRSPATLRTAAERYNEKADLITYTEVQAENREGAVRRANGKEFGFVSGDKSYSNDCAISFRKERFELLHKENFKSTNLFWYNVKGRKRDPQYATIGVFLDKVANKKLVVTVIHLASAVEDPMSKGVSTRRTAAWYSSFRRTKKRSNKLKRKYKAKGILLIADYNLDFKKRWVRALLKSLAPAYRLTWKKVNQIKGGTHYRGRIIDATLIKGKIKVRGSARLMKDDNSSDHRPYIETLVWK